MDEFSSPYIQFEGGAKPRPAGLSSGGTAPRVSASAQPPPPPSATHARGSRESLADGGARRRGAFARACRWCCGKREPEARHIRLNATRPTPRRYARNLVVNTKYSFFSFVPKVLYEQFSQFFNLYFLVVALSQLFPPLQIGLLFTYIAPLAFVLAVTMCKEGFDDYKRYRTDREINTELYTRLTPGGGDVTVAAQDISVGHVLRVRANQRVPADLLLLRTKESSGILFLRTDQLDGEEEAGSCASRGTSHRRESRQALAEASGGVYAPEPTADIYAFEGDPRPGPKRTSGQAHLAPAPPGDLTLSDSEGDATEPLSLDNTLWAGTVLASGEALALVLYTGTDTRGAMNSAPPRSKAGSALAKECQPPRKGAPSEARADESTSHPPGCSAKVLFGLTASTALAMVAVPFIQRAASSRLASAEMSQQLLQALERRALLDFCRFLLLFSSIIPISLRVALDMAKLVYKLQMTSDARMPGLQVRSSTLPEELGGIDFLLTDKTGTLTRNEMLFRKLHLGFAFLSPQ
ncbi:hypothetical protein EMIHUDRAFT_459573, partial [Emiliania huxleyi CCMP1516]|uniref:P-type ATPase N-terminal domain-containing protein n=2 Tax=Emiliania huxleyi TaxID=2903 RepID=A0A0D3IPX9_EMIH1